MAAELMVIRDGILAWNQSQTGDINIFSDSLDVVHALHTSHQYIGYEEAGLTEVRALMHNSYVKGVWYYHRKKNTLAYKLAQIAMRSPHSQAWVGDDTPRHIMSLVQAL